MRILVTGGAGFIGSRIVERYLELGHEVFIWGNRIIPADLPRGAIGQQVDIREDYFVSSMMRQIRPDVVSHHAAKISVTDSMSDPASDAQTNLIGGLNVLKAAIDCGAQRFIFASSAAVYGDCNSSIENPLHEFFLPMPTNPYGIAKLTFERYLQIFSDKITPIILRYANVYEMSGAGPGAHSQFWRALKNNQACIIRGDGLATRDYVHVDDVAVANVAALTCGDFETMNISTQTETTTLQVFEQVKAALKQPDAQPVFVESGAGEVERSVLSNARAREVLGWQPQVFLNSHA